MPDDQEAFAQRKADTDYTRASLKLLVERSQLLRQLSADLIAKSGRLKTPPR